MKNSGKIVFSMVLLAGFLPVMLWLVISKDKFTLLTHADQNKQIRMWVEPAEVVMAPGQTYEFKVVAESEDANVLVPRVDLKLSSTAGLSLASNTINYPYAFGGKAEIGAVKAVATSPGKYSINIDEPSVVTGLTDVPVVVAPAIVIVK